MSNSTTERVERNDPVSALAIRLLVSAGACSQQDANTAFHAACTMLEDEAVRQSATLPWVVRKLAPLTDEQIARIYETPELAGTQFDNPTEKAIALARAIERAHGIRA